MCVSDAHRGEEWWGAVIVIIFFGEDGKYEHEHEYKNNYDDEEE